ncbi:hypothetical protein [Candidatus Viridilinea mediisalina]|uniref:hypothetical protein n=1 Tax=Candidatus Viridilinea mediisalina TaxID=2024553 RepID=UPI0013FD59B9|nr:hypothetical protein [Candidatus Viridilinea mediisalina]
MASTGSASGAAARRPPRCRLPTQGFFALTKGLRGRLRRPRTPTGGDVDVALVIPITLEHAALSRTLTPIGMPCSVICNLQSTIVNGIIHSGLQCAR